MRKLTLSKVGLAGSCLYSFRDDVQAPPQETNIFAQNGTVFGEAVANAVCGLPVPEMNETTQSFYDQWSLHYTLEDFGVCLPEIALALDVVTSEVKFLGVNIGRGYAASGAGPDDICGSIDLAGVKDGRLYVWEWKSGVQYHLTRYNNPQCRSYGALLAKLLGFSSVTCITVVVNETGVREYVEEVLDISDSLEYIISRAEEIDLGDPKPQPGEHCKTAYCPLAAVCPGTTKASAELMKPTPLVLETVADVAKTIEKLFALEAQAAAIWKAVDARVQELGEDIALPSGKSYGAKTTERESILVNAQGKEILAKHGLEDAVEVKITKSSIKSIVKTRAPKGQAAALERQVIDELRDAECVKTSFSIGYGVK